MKDLVIAIYKDECYAGETTQRLVKVLCLNEELPAEYQTYGYELRLMRLEDYAEGNK